MPLRDLITESNAFISSFLFVNSNLTYSSDFLSFEVSVACSGILFYRFTSSAYLSISLAPFISI